MFSHDNIIDGMIRRRNTIEIQKETIQRILLDTGIKTAIDNIGEPHAWIMQSQRVFLEDGRCLLLKVGINPEWTDASAILNQVAATEIIRTTGIKQPQILDYSTNIDEFGFLYILSENQSGIRLCDTYKTATKLERERLYGAIGQAYSCIHSMANDWSGVWDGSPSKKKYSIHPAEFYSMAEFHVGSAKYLLENGIISSDGFKELCTTWDENISYLKQRPTSLVHVSPFPWSIYINRNENEYSATGFAALGDFMWWDSMADVAHLLYPPFMDITKEEQRAFIAEYDKPMDEYAINLYMLLNRLCAMSGCYLSPVRREFSKTWVKQEVKTLQITLDKIRRIKG
jgi:hypothetical protein